MSGGEVTGEELAPWGYQKLPELLFVCASIHFGDFTGLTLLSAQAKNPAYPFAGQHRFIYIAIITLDLPGSHKNIF